VATTEGKLYYQGPYLPYSGRTTVRESDLSIDAKATYLHGAESADFVSDFLAGRERSSAHLPQPLPFLYLENGSILLPARSYQAEKGGSTKSGPRNGTEARRRMVQPGVWFFRVSQCSDCERGGGGS